VTSTLTAGWPLDVTSFARFFFGGGWGVFVFAELGTEPSASSPGPNSVHNTPWKGLNEWVLYLEFLEQTVYVSLFIHPGLPAQVTVLAAPICPYLLIALSPMSCSHRWAHLSSQILTLGLRLKVTLHGIGPGIPRDHLEGLSNILETRGIGATHLAFSKCWLNKWMGFLKSAYEWICCCKHEQGTRSWWSTYATET
jgi:hypothetical protein